MYIVRLTEEIEIEIAYASHEKNSQRSTRIFSDMRFSRGSQKRLLYHNTELSENSLGRFSVKIRPKLEKLNSHFEHIFMNN